MSVSAGGVASGAFIETGGTLMVDVDERTHVEGTSGGTHFEGENGIFTGAIGNGSVRISSGCMAISVTVTGNGLLKVLGGGLASATTVSGGGALTVSRGGKAKRVVVGDGGHFTVSSGGTVTGRMTFEPGANVTMEKDSVLDFDLRGPAKGMEL